jgi:ubiquinone biosynthesis protein UbiJ
MSHSKTPLSPREHEVLDIVGEVMQERLAEVRRDIAALEARLAKLEESKRRS